MNFDTKFRKFVLVPLLAVAGAGLAATLATSSFTDASLAAPKAVMKKTAAVAFPPITSASATVPSDISVGAGSATITQAATFAWQEFIALNWPAAVAPQYTAMTNQRGMANTALNFGDDVSGTDPNDQPVVWETYRAKVETFPGTGQPPGYPNSTGANNYGFNAGPAYAYGSAYTNGLVPACESAQNGDAVPWVNLDETSQIGEDFMFAGLVPPAVQSDNAQPQLIRFLAKGNGTFYNYVATYQLWLRGKGSNFDPAQKKFAAAAARNAYSSAVNNTFPPNPLPATPPTVLSLPAGTILVKAAWRELTSTDDPTKFHVKTVRYYEAGAGGNACYRDKTWGLLALHIIQKTPSAPYFVFATFEQSDNIVTTGGTPVENTNGKETNAPSGGPISPAVNYYDALYSKTGANNPPGNFYSPDYPKGITPPPSPPGDAVNPSDPNYPIAQVNSGDAYCAVGAGTTPAANARLYYQNANLSPPNTLPYSNNPNEGICVNKRYFPIPKAVIAVNSAAHAAIATYGAKGPWQNYKLVNVQWQPFNTADIDTTGANTRRLVSTYYLSNSVVETDNTLQQFFGALSNGGLKTGFETPDSQNEVSTSTRAHNIYLSPGPKEPQNQFHRNIMGGCMGCHGRAERAGSDFSFTLNNGPVSAPDFAVADAPPTANLTALSTVPPGAAAGAQPGVAQDRIQAIRRALVGSKK
ncbi:MAG TPA: hypothetical protein VGB91_12530 [Rhizomicrobium sp.]